MFAAKRVIYFTSSDHYVYRQAGGALLLEAKFSGDDLGITEFRDYLRGRKGALFAVVADLAGEDFHEDQIPYLRGNDRQMVLARRLAQRYRDTRLAAALGMGYVAGERRNERVLLASFTNTQQFTPWLDALAEAGARLAGVYSVPLLAPALAERLGAKSGRCFVVTADRAGLRQSYIEDGKLRFSRLEPTVDMVPQALAVFIRSETLRLAQYLSTLRALPRDGPPVQVLVTALPGQHAAFQQALVSDARLAFHTFEFAEASKRAGLKGAPEGALAEVLYLRLALKKPPREQFARSEDRRGYHIWQAQRGIVAAGALGLAACAVAAGARWFDAMNVRARAEDQRAQASRAAEQYQRITAAFPVTQTTSDNLKAAVVEFSRIAARSAAPEPAFVHVSRVLEQFPQIDIDTLVWSIGRPDGSSKPPAQTPAAGEEAELIEIAGRVIATQRSDYRGITAQVQRFAAALGTGGYEPVRTQLPFDVTSEGTLTGDITAGQDTGEAPRFTVLVGKRLK